MGAEVAVAVATLGLGGATVYLGIQARRQVNLLREQFEATWRPFVYPVISREWDLATQRMPIVELKNGGVGPAFNVSGALYWQGGAGGASALAVPNALAASEKTAAPVTAQGIDVNWPMALGYTRYSDLGGTEWQTHFRYREDGQGHLSVQVEGVGTTPQLGEPQYNPERWENAPSLQPPG